MHDESLLRSFSWSEIVKPHQHLVDFQFHPRSVQSFKSVNPRILASMVTMDHGRHQLYACMHCALLIPPLTYPERWVDSNQLTISYLGIRRYHTYVPRIGYGKVLYPADGGRRKGAILTRARLIASSRSKHDLW